jgi:hypothetical protein
MNANNELNNYPLPEHVERALVAADKLAMMLVRHGQPAPDSIQLTTADYHVVDTLLRSISDGRISAHQVTWYGRPIDAA